MAWKLLSRWVAASAPPPIEEIQAALDEQRYADAARMLTSAELAGDRTPRLSTLSGELNLARGRYAEALADFSAAARTSSERAQALQGEGVALSLLNRPDLAVASLERAVVEAPAAWRAWNALGAEYDRRKDWARSENAYAQALIHSGAAAIVLNNRGYSRLLQRRPREAADDLAAALKKKPDLAAARTNLRLALAMAGNYAGAVAPTPADDTGALLNNAGLVARLTGDRAMAQDLLGQAMKARSEFYRRAAENLEATAPTAGGARAANP